MQNDDRSADDSPSGDDLAALWTVVFGEPPPLVTDPALMLDLAEAELIGAAPQAETPTPIGQTTPVPPIPQ